MAHNNALHLEGSTSDRVDTESWLASTAPEWIEELAPAGSRPDPAKGMHWSRGDATIFQVRTGPDYPKHGKKIRSADALYECIGVDIVRGAGPIYEVLGRLIPVPRSTQTLWKPGCPLPRILCFVAMLPYTCDWRARDPAEPYSSDDPGCSVISLYSITPETLRVIASGEPLPPSIRAFQEFVRDAKCKQGDKATSGCLKGIAWGENPDELSIPWGLGSIVDAYNGQPVLITRSGHVTKADDGEWFEVDIDVRVFSYAARSALYHLRECLPFATVHLGFTIQGCNDDELPECMICNCRVHNMDIINSPAFITDARWAERECTPLSSWQKFD